MPHTLRTPPNAGAGLSHFDERGRARMVDVGGKPATERAAVAEGRIRMAAATLALLREGGHRKGDVLGIARLAGIMAAKQTAQLIPLCHPLMLTHVAVEFEIDERQNSVKCVATTRTRERTGVEMEALTAVQVALLAIYDMCKAADRGMVIGEVCVAHKSGGRSGTWQRGQRPAVGEQGVSSSRVIDDTPR